MESDERPGSAADLAHEVESLRARFPETRQLYQEVCALLFFRHGITPTANKLYQLVRKGSMSAPAEALSRFWENLREKSRVRIEHPDLPPELAQLAGGVMGELWQRAQAGAQATFEAAMAESRKAVTDAEGLAAKESARAETAALALFQLQAEFSASLTRTQEIEHALAREQGQRESVERQVASAITQRREMQETLAAARREFEAQLEAQRHSHRQAEAQLQAEAGRLAIEADRGRALAQSLQRELGEVRTAGAAAAERHGEQTRDLELQVSRLGQQLALAEGSIAELRSTRDLLRQQLEKAATLNRGSSGRQRGRILRRP